MHTDQFAWLKPGLVGAVCGAAILAVVGFQWGGWVTAGNATTLSRTAAQSAVVEALTPICLDAAKRDPDFATKMIELKKASSYSRSEEIVKAGWGTTLSTESTNKMVARACADKLLL